MVNVLEILYVATVASTLAAGVAWLRGTRTAARTLLAIAVTCAIAAGVLYWYLTPPG